MIRKIELKGGMTSEYIARKVGVTPAAVSYALNFKRNSPISEQIRAMAMANGGVYLEEPENKRTTKVLDSHGNVIKTI